MKEKETALLLVDVQEAFKDEAYWGGNRNNPQAEQNITLLLADWRSKGWPVIHVKHNSKNPSSLLHATNPGNQIMDFARPHSGEPLFEKQVNSGFIGTGLQAYLDEQEIKSLLIVGFISDHCVSTTARMAGNLGYEVFVASDATATFDRIGPEGEHYKSEEIHRISLASLHEEFATIVRTENMLSSAKEGSYGNL
ncbi:nicotinamidase-related amidase [Pontibacter ummariensis]|uniref:Nicotinamidase-related amidase n=1 Tax=Pontibacter ummariensis TaxID=1610492 RepID=A0A239LKU6_9BACT|nr:cysteine hydrolase family protein [Pontibacter ummariensis]PRY03127.1 nicotinamidase-related amidase [Pontibacter ummariensis]SNT30204.1 Nicotinamidase-related amidase [Pontibacter ummariensis]